MTLLVSRISQSRVYHGIIPQIDPFAVSDQRLQPQALSPNPVASVDSRPRLPHMALISFWTRCLLMFLRLNTSLK